MNKIKTKNDNVDNSLNNQSKQPNKTTQKAIKEARVGKNVEKITLDKLKSNQTDKLYHQ